MNENQRKLEEKAWTLLKKQKIGAMILYPEKRKRKGCDLCKDPNCPTEQFVGFSKTTLWICDTCIKELKEWN